MPYPVSGGQVVYDIAARSNKIYIFGGYSDSLQSAVDWIQEYDAKENSWKMVGHMIQREINLSRISGRTMLYILAERMMPQLKKCNRTMGL